MPGKTVYTQGKDGKMTGSQSLGGKTPPTSADAATLTATPDVAVPGEPGYGVMYSVFQAAAPATEPRSTGKQGTDIPPLVVETAGSGRYYVDHPDHRAHAMADIDAALDTGKAFPSVTNVISSFSNDAITKYATGKVSAAAIDRFRSLRDMDTDEERIAALDAWLAEDDRGDAVAYRELLDSYIEDRDSAASRGTEVHAIVEAISHGQNPDIPESFTGYVRAYMQFRERFPDMEVLYTEATVINRADGTMGTADAIVRIGDKNYVLDYKTNKSGTVYQKTGMQLAAAANGEAIVYPDGSTEPMPEIAGGIGVGLSPTGKCGVFYFETARGGPNHQGLQAAVSAWRWQRQHRSRSVAITRDELDRLA